MFTLFRSHQSSGRTALVLNCGSSSVKYQLFKNDSSVMRGSIDNIGLPQCAHSAGSDKRPLGKDFGFSDSINLAISSVLAKADGSIDCVGHRVVHGGPTLTAPSVVDAAVLSEIRRCSSLAPLHNPSNIKGIEAASSLLPNVPQVACFDTAFHASIPEKAYRYALPKDLAEAQRIRRYGFHGLSYAYISSVVKERRIIVAHLGSGCSAAAIKDRNSVDTTMGLTPMEGLVMSTRSGTIDPGIVLHLMNQPGATVESVTALINKMSGLLGLSGGITSDMKEMLRLSKAGQPDAIAAVDIFVYTVQKYLGQLMAALEFSVDGIVFTGGIGENSAEIRSRVMAGFTNLGIQLDASMNDSVPSNGYISTRASKVSVMAIKTNEELQIARDSIKATNQ